MSVVSHLLTITQGNINNGHFYLTEIMDMFPLDVFGGPNKACAAVKTVRILWGNNVVETDIDQAKHIFRKRGWVARFFDACRIRANDRIVVEQLTPYLYRVSPAEKRN